MEELKVSRMPVEGWSNTHLFRLQWLKDTQGRLH